MKDSGIFSFAALLALASTANASCAYGTWLRPRSEEGTVEVATFGYSGPTGPANWDALDDENTLCAIGTRQSPINLIENSLPVIPAAHLSLCLADLPSGAVFENLGSTVEVVTVPEKECGATVGESTMTFNGVDYILQQFHFHLPSEHLDDGESLAMEMHMVWEGEGGEIAVIGVFVDIDDGTDRSRPGKGGHGGGKKPECPGEGGSGGGKKPTDPSRPASNSTLPASNSTLHRRTYHPSTAATTPSTLLETVLGAVEEIEEPGTLTKTPPLVMAEEAKILNKGTFQTYEGSLTTPPCSEGVRWLVSDQKLSIKPSTFIKARGVIGYNARFPQNTPGGENVLS